MNYAKSLNCGLVKEKGGSFSNRNKEVMKHARKDSGEARQGESKGDKITNEEFRLL